jgi:hypothetical protein
MNRFILVSIVLLAVIGLAGWWIIKNPKSLYPFVQGDKVDSLNGVYVYYNGPVSNISGRSWTPDKYNLGLKYQCVEFVKRYYYEHLKHKMPDSYGHAKDFYDIKVKDGAINSTRDLLQFKNPSKSKPKPNDLLIFDKTSFNEYGHVAIISIVEDDRIEIVQQNPGPFGSSRITMKLEYNGSQWNLENPQVLGWLRKQ